MHFGVFKAFAMTCFGSHMNATLEMFGQKRICSALATPEIPRVSDISGVAKYVASSGHNTWKHVPPGGSRPKAFYSKILPKKMIPSIHCIPWQNFLRDGASKNILRVLLQVLLHQFLSWGTELTNESPKRCDSKSTAQSPFEILEAGLPGSSLEPRGKEAQPPPGAPGLGGPARDCWGFAKYLGGLRPVWPALSTKTRAHCTDCICAQKAQLETNNGH